MKTINLFIFLLCSQLVFTSCQKTEHISPWDDLPNDGSITIKRADKKWKNVSITSSFSPIDGYLNLSVRKLEGRERHTLVFQFIPEKIGAHSICLGGEINIEDPSGEKKAIAQYSRVIPDDAWIARYECVENTENHFTISEYDVDSRMIRGSFEIHLEATYISPTRKEKEFITFVADDFSVQIKDD